MLSHSGEAATFTAFFTANRVGVPGLTVLVDLYDPTGTAVVTGAATTEIGGGFYAYTAAAGTLLLAGNYCALFRTTDGTVDSAHLPALWIARQAWVERVDAAVSTRSSHTPADVWAAGTRTLTSFGTLVADGAAAVWGAVGRTLTAFGFQATLGGYASGQDPATLVLGHTATGYSPGTIGAAIHDAGTAADPLQNTAASYLNPASLGYLLAHLTGELTFVGPVLVGGTLLKIIAGSALQGEHSTGAAWTLGPSPDLTDSTVTLELGVVGAGGTVALLATWGASHSGDGTNVQVVTLDPQSSAATALLAPAAGQPLQGALWAAWNDDGDRVPVALFPALVEVAP